jgi:hypothetical protein
MSLQRSLQNGRQGETSDHSTGRLQVGQVTDGIVANWQTRIAGQVNIEDLIVRSIRCRTRDVFLTAGLPS